MIFSHWVDAFDQEFPYIFKSDGNQSENDLREYASKHGYKLCNWSITQKHMMKGKSLMFSQIYLTSQGE